MKPKRTYKDSLFRNIFNNKKNLLALYNALEGTSLTDPKLIRITTLRGIFFNDLKNDISFQIGDQLVILLEHQSTINANMPLRFLFYLAKLYQRGIDSTLPYREHLVHIPAPKFYVFYNGKKEEPEQRILKLSDAFAQPVKSLELMVQAYNINYDSNKSILQKCSVLRDYSIFVQQVRNNITSGMSLSSAIRSAMDYCISNDIMKNYLEDKQKEVYDMVSVEWNMDTAKKVWFEDGIQEGQQKTKEMTALGMLRDKMDVHLIMKYTKLSMDRINELAKML